MNKIICGKCAMDMNKSLDERKEMVNQFKEGLNVCSCGRELIIKNGVLRYS